MKVYARIFSIGPSSLVGMALISHYSLKSGALSVQWQLNFGLDITLTIKSTNRNIKMDEISWNDFEKIALHAGTIIEVEDFPEARNPAYKVRVDFGRDIGIKKSSAQITGLYDRESLIGRQVVAVVNFPPKQIGPMRSECLITGFHREDGSVVLAVPDSNVPNGAKLA